MNVGNGKLEAASAGLEDEFSSLFLNGYTEITHSIINVQEGVVLTLPSRYDWHLQYWGSDLDLRLMERCKEGVHAWTEYSQYHDDVLSKNVGAVTKFDICTPIEEGFELFSVSRTAAASQFSAFVNIHKLKAAVSHYVTSITSRWKDNMLLPLRATTAESSNCDTVKLTSIGEYPHFFFNGITFSEIEMRAIKELLALKSLKEIAALNNCTTTAEKRRIVRIKQKLDCDNQPLSRVFEVLKQKGITAACLDTYITYQ